MSATTGNRYRVDREFTGVSSGQSGYFGITPKKGVIVKVRRAQTDSNDIRFALYENQPYTAGTLSDKVFNVDANALVQTPPEDFYTTVIPTNVLTDDDIKFFQVSYDSSEINEETEYTLKPGTPYIIEVKNRFGNNANLYVSLEAVMSK
jgi:hypothetical protein